MFFFCKHFSLLFTYMNKWNSKTRPLSQTGPSYSPTQWHWNPELSAYGEQNPACWHGSEAHGSIHENVD